MRTCSYARPMIGSSLDTFSWRTDFPPSPRHIILEADSISCPVGQNFLGIAIRSSIKPLLHDQAQNVFNSLKQAGDQLLYFMHPTYVTTLFMKKYKFILCLCLVQSGLNFIPSVRSIWTGPKNIHSLFLQPTVY